MTPKPDVPDSEPDRPESIGALLARLRVAHGYSQLRLAELLCATSGTPTVSRHEISRWEREERIPGSFWLGWLAAVLEAPLSQLEAATARARRGDPTRPAGDGHRLWQPPGAGELLAALDQAGAHDLRELAHAWLAGPPEQGLRGTGRPRPARGLPRTIDEAGARLRDLRRMDDLVGGLDLARHVDRELRAAIDALGAGRGGEPRRRSLRFVAELAQLAGWVHADAGDLGAARRAYRVALRAAAAASDRPFAAHVLGALSHLSLDGGDPHEALLLARTGYVGARRSASALTRALLLHRVALAAAHAGDRRAAAGALHAAERAGDRADPGAEPDWLYWLDETERAAMTGRCLAALSRPLRAVALLARERSGVGPRTAALYGGHLAHTYLDLGEMEQACQVAAAVLRDTVRAGSARAAAVLRRLHPRLVRHREVPAVRGYERLAQAAAGYLPAAPAAGPLNRRRSEG